jgi:hypothetical protein
VVEEGFGTNDDIADLLLGSMGVFAAHDQTFLGATTGRRWKLFRPFAQDDWRVSSNLTLNLGFAWALATPETEVENRMANYNIQNLSWYVPKGSPMLASCTICVASNSAAGLQFDKTALEPRFGFAWKPTKSDATVVRGGYAIFHDSAWNQGGQGLWQNPPYYAEVDTSGLCATPGATGCGLSNGFLVPVGTPSSTQVNANGAVLSSPVNPADYTGTIQSANLNFKQGQVQQFNFNVEHQLPENVVLTVGYAGSRSHHILVSQLNENLNNPAACPGGSDYNPANNYTLGCGFGNFPYAVNQPGGGAYQTVASNNSVGAARYDSLQVKAETKSSRAGLYALIGYTYSRNFDSGMPDGLGTNPGALYYPLPGTAKLDWGLSELNLNNSFTASVIYDLPFGKGKHFASNAGGAVNAIIGNWQVNLIERATSGYPLYVVDSADESGTYFSYNGFTLQRPNQVGNPNVAGNEGGQTGCPTKIHTVQNWFNYCAFAQAPAGELGTAVRAPVYGPRFVNTDFSVIKDIPLHETIALQFRAEFFNLLNHPQFFLEGIGDSGQQDINTPSSFGVINNTVNNPRLVQFALKLKF